MRPLCLIFFLLMGISYAQETTTSAANFFLNHEPIDVTLTFDQKQLINQNKNKEEYQPAHFKCFLEDSTLMESDIELRPRGFFRRNYCYMPPIKLKFEDSDNEEMRKWEEMKMVTYCKQGLRYEEYVLSEYLCYRMFNLLTDNSFRVRLAKVTYVDTEEKKKTETSWGFFIEDVDVLADRLGGKELNDVKIHTERTDRDHMTLVSVFEYFLGNTDWSVPANHNIKLIQLKDPEYPRPLAIPYDFDYSGMVNTTYAIPSDHLPIDNVRERLFRGYCRLEEEFESVFELFRGKQSEIVSLIENFEYLDKRNKKTTLRYIDDFYKIINSPGTVKWEFKANCIEN